MAPPKLSYHKAREQYYARFDGKMVYFGKDPAEAHQRFAEALTLYENGNPVTPRTKEDALTIVEASNRFLRAFEGYYAVLRPFMLRDSDAYMFSPKESERERHNKATVHRRPNQAPNPRKTKRALGDAYTSDSLRRAIEYACKKAGVPKWTPYRLRHTAATEIRRRYGLEGAQVVLGHAALGVTQVYAERDFEKAARIISEVG